MVFLENIAIQLLSEYSDRLFRHCVVFPSRRAGIFFKKYLAEHSTKTIRAPQIITINELFQSASTLKPIARESIVFELYKLYKNLSKRNETLDSFYFWGEMLISDFDDIDKYMVNAEQLFTNINDIHNIDERFGELPPDKIKIIEQFIHNFSIGNDTEQKRDFRTNWSLLYPLYAELKMVLKNRGVAYEGMIYSDVANNIDNIIDSFREKFDKFHFIGFNALNKCEQLLMKSLKRQNMAAFYWDYFPSSPIFKDDTNSGFFIIPNIKEFGQDYRSAYSETPTLPHIEIIDTPSDVGQAKLTATLLKQYNIDKEASLWQKSAIIPANEELLPALLSSIPTEIEDINVTMGYPFKLTVVYSLLHTLLEIQNSKQKSGFNIEYVHSILSNPLLKQLSNDSEILQTLLRTTCNAKELISYLKEVIMVLAEKIYSSNSENDTENDTENEEDGANSDNFLLLKEFVFKALQVLNELEPLFDCDSDNIDKKIAIKLIDRIFKQISVPFSGEPLKGLQIMGILESRALDFDNIIILGANEGELPHLSKSSSYIPYNLRIAFGLPTIEHQDSIYSYYFSRLLTRAKKVALIYNSSAEGLKTGEMSRFLLRLKYGSVVKVEQRPTLMRIVTPPTLSSLQPQRNQQTIEKLEERFLFGNNSRPLSPSAINDWIGCRKKFFYKHIANIKEPDEIVEGFDVARFGTLLHEVVSRIYKPYINKEVTKETIVKIKNDSKTLETLIEEEIKSSYFNGSAYSETGNILLLADMIRLNLDRVLYMDSCFAPFSIISLEQSYSTNLAINYKGNEIAIKIGGTIDRIDKRNGVWRLIDYKTGKAELSVKNISDLFNEKGNSAVIQTLIYCFVMSNTHNSRELQPFIYNLRSKHKSSYSDNITINKQAIERYSYVAQEFELLLKECVESIFNPNEPFNSNTRERKTDNGCKHCPFLQLCQ